MLIPPSHLFGLVAHPLIDKSLIDALDGQIRGEAVAEGMEANDDLILAGGQLPFPAGPSQRPLEAPMGPAL